MPVTYQLRLKDETGAVVAITDDFAQLGYTKRVNAPGTFVLAMQGANPFLADIGLDYQLEAWRADAVNSIAWQLDFEGLLRTETRQRDAQGKEEITLYGVGYAELLARRIILGFAGTAFTEKTGLAEAVMKQFVTEQCVASAVVRVIAGLTVQAPGGTGNAVTVARAWRNLLEVLQEIALIGGGDFAVVGTGAGTFQFRWYLGQLGDDRTEGNGVNPPVIFSIGFGNMAIPVYSLARTEEVDAIYVGGQGEGVARNVRERTDPAAIADSPWNRREIFLDARNEATNAGLDSKGDRGLQEFAAQESFAFKVIQTATCLYGRDYFLGDLVTAKYGAITRNKKIVGVTVSVQTNRENIELELADVP